MLMTASVLLHASVAALVLTRSPVTPMQGAEETLVQVSLMSAQSARPAPGQGPATVVPGRAVAFAKRAPEPTRDPVSLSGESQEQVYLPSAMMERRPTPVSAPDLERIRVAPVSGLPIRLRIYVASSGNVTRVEQLSVHALDQDFAGSVAAMFEETLFLPGRRGGEDKNAYLDIELLAE